MIKYSRFVAVEGLPFIAMFIFLWFLCLFFQCTWIFWGGDLKVFFGVMSNHFFCSYRNTAAHSLLRCSWFLEMKLISGVVMSYDSVLARGRSH